MAAASVLVDYLTNEAGLEEQILAAARHCRSARIAVYQAQAEALEGLLCALGDASADIVIGLSDGLTDPQALRLALAFAQGRDDTRVSVKGWPRQSPRFHPKLYIFEGKRRGIVFCGSANLTVAAFTTWCGVLV